MNHFYKKTDWNEKNNNPDKDFKRLYKILKPKGLNFFDKIINYFKFKYISWYVNKRQKGGVI